MKDNPCLYMQTPETTLMASGKVFNKECVYKFFDEYESILDEYKFTNQIYKVDETGLLRKSNINLVHLQVMEVV